VARHVCGLGLDTIQGRRLNVCDALLFTHNSFEPKFMKRGRHFGADREKQPSWLFNDSVT
jgi:hypothetical protein